MSESAKSSKLSTVITSVIGTVLGALAIGFFATIWYENQSLRNRVAELEQDLPERIARLEQSSSNPTFDRVVCRSVEIVDDRGNQLAKLGKYDDAGGGLYVRRVGQTEGEYMARIIAGGNGGYVEVRAFDFTEFGRLYVENNEKGHIVLWPAKGATAVTLPR